MGLETGTYINSLVATNPVVGDDVAQGDDHLRLLKSVILNTAPNVTGAITATHTQLNYTVGVTSALQTQIDAKAPIASPTFTGTPTLPTGTIATTQTAGNSTTAVATTAFVTAGITAHASGDWVLMQTQTPTAVAQCDFVNGTGGVIISTAYDAYRIEITGLLPATTATDLYVRTSTNAGVAYDVAATDYRYMGSTQPSNSATISGFSGGTGATQYNATGGTHTVSSAAGDGVTGTLELGRLTDALNARMRFDATFGNGASFIKATSAGQRNIAADVDAIRLLFSAGNIASGTVKFYGRRV